MSGDLTEYINDLSAAALDCKWRPSSRSEYEDTFAIASAIVNAFLAEGSSRNSPLERLPLPLLKKIFEMAIAAHGDQPRRALEDVCRFFRSVVFTSNELWNDLTTFPTDSAEFMRMLVLSRCAERSLRLTVDLVAGELLGASPRPHGYLLGTALFDATSIVIRSYDLTVLSLYRPLIGLLLNADEFPGLNKLVLCSRLALMFREGNFLPVFISTPDLRVARLENAGVILRDTTRLTEFGVNARLSRRAYTSGRLRRPVDHRWPKTAMHDILVRNSQLTKLHLFDAVRMDQAGAGLDDVVQLPYLRELLLGCIDTTQAAWFLRKLNLPASTHIALHLGFGSRRAPDYGALFDAMAQHLEKREFTAITGYHSMFFTGVLLSPGPRRSSRNSQFWPARDSWLANEEIGSRGYHDMPGAVDVYVVWVTMDTPKKITWPSLFQKMTQYVNTVSITSLEAYSQYGERDALLRVEVDHLPLHHITELRLWHSFHRSLSLALVHALLHGDDGRESPRVRDVAEALISTFPDVTRIVDMNAGHVWEKSSSTFALVEAIAMGFSVV